MPTKTLFSSSQAFDYLSLPRKKEERIGPIKRREKRDPPPLPLIKLGTSEASSAENEGMAGRPRERERRNESGQFRRNDWEEERKEGKGAAVLEK